MCDAAVRGTTFYEYRCARAAKHGVIATVAGYGEDKGQAIVVNVCAQHKSKLDKGEELRVFHGKREGSRGSNVKFVKGRQTEVGALQASVTRKEEELRWSRSDLDNYKTRVGDAASVYADELLALIEGNSRFDSLRIQLQGLQRLRKARFDLQEEIDDLKARIEGLTSKIA